ncbi:MAG: 2-C-methyl-D-erythritol 2,4-cyclodiphosphate synthase [Elusimicrobia bacterium]|nr:2-C-methyl-D-erythritol 2,4-cyclodiphosphate synthase [Candidatus Liberimonas magnetica]
MYIGLGYDVHRFTKKKPLVLGGITLKSPLGLLGHSDADVLTHSLMDAILGACGLKDIGHYFPNTDPRLRNISSFILLEKVLSLLKKQKKKVNNIDITIIAQKPKISPCVEKIKKNLSKTLRIPVSRIGLKATTNEKIGFIGRGEGIAAITVVSIL